MYARKVNLKRGPPATIYFFSKRKHAKSDLALEKPPRGIDLSEGKHGVDQSIWEATHRADVRRFSEKIRALKSMTPEEFELWACEKLGATPSRRRSGDLGIDGWIQDRRPLQIKQSEHVSRPVVDAFETAVRRDRKRGGSMVAFSFSAGAYGEVDRAKNQDGLEIKLVTVIEILAGKRAARTPPRNR